MDRPRCRGAFARVHRRRHPRREGGALRHRRAARAPQEGGLQVRALWRLRLHEIEFDEKYVSDRGASSADSSAPPGRGGTCDLSHGFRSPLATSTRGYHPSLLRSGRPTLRRRSVSLCRLSNACVRMRWPVAHAPGSLTSSWRFDAPRRTHPQPLPLGGAKKKGPADWPSPVVSLPRSVVDRVRSAACRAPAFECAGPSLTLLARWGVRGASTRRSEPTPNPSPREGRRDSITPRTTSRNRRCWWRWGC